jgi:hypothetical protein
VIWLKYVGSVVVKTIVALTTLTTFTTLPTTLKHYNNPKNKLAFRFLYVFFAKNNRLNG